MAAIRVLVADDHPVVRTGLRTMLSGQVDVEVVGEAADAADAVTLTAELRPDIVLLDLNMPRGGGVGCVRSIREVGSGARVLVLSMLDDPAVVREALQAGASGYLAKHAVDTELALALRAVKRGEIYVHSSLTQAVIEEATGRLPAAADGQSRYELLSKREKEVFQGLTRGYTNQQIADRLCLSAKTIETHRAHLLEKLGVRSRAELVQFALDHELLTPEPPSRT
jgi:two-component system, NarL family, response regulator NreC